MLDLDTWDSTIGASQAARVYSISKKLDNGERLSDGEQMIVDALVDDLASDIYLASGFGRGYKAGRVTGESLPFMIETAVNPASSLGKGITKKFGKEIFKQVSKKLGKTMAKAAVYGTRVAGDIAGASIMSATTSQPRVVADALDRLTGEVDFKINEDGTLGFDGFVGGEDSTLKAYAKAFGSNAIEHYSEMIGNYFYPIGKMTKNGVANLADKIGAKKIKSLLTEMTPNGFGALLGDFAEQTQWHGTIGEFAEEMISGALNALVVGDQTLKKYDENGNLNQNYLFEKENMIDTFLGVAILGGVMSTAKTLGYTTPEARLNKAISDAKAGLEGVVSEEEMRQLEAFASNPMGADYANLDPFFDKSREEGYKRAVGRYVAAIMEKQGYNIAKSADLSGTKQGMNELMNAYRAGQNMSEADLYDVTDAEAKAQQALVDSGFLNAAGEDGTGIMQHTLGYSSYNLFTLADKLERDNGIVLDDKQRAALKNLAVIKNAREGLENKLNGYTRMAIAANEAVSNGAAKNGILTVGFHNGKKVYVKGGVKVSNGSISKPSDITSYPVEIVDSMTGEATTVESGELSNVENIDLAVYNKNMADAITNAYNLRWEGWRNTKSAKSKLAEVEKFVGQKVFINTPDGKMAEVEVQQILPNGEVLIKGKKGDLGQQNIRVDADSFYDSMSRDADGNPIFNQADFRSQSSNIKAAQNRLHTLGQQGSTVATAPTATTPAVAQGENTAPETAPAPEVEVSEEDDFRGLVAPILINGVPVEVEVLSQDNPSDTIVYEYTDENGNTKRGRTTIGGFKAAIQEAQNYQPEVPIEETPIAEEVPTEVTSETPASEDVPVEEVELTPENIDWDVLFAQDPEAYFVELQNQFGEETLDILNEEVEAAQNELDSLAKAKTKSQNERIKNRNKKAALQNRIDILNGMIARLTPAQDVAAETPVESTPETPIDVTPEVPAAEPYPVEEAPTAETPVEEPAGVQPEPQPVQAAPVAPNPVDNPVREAQKKEKSLATQLMRYDLSHELKQDLAFKAGKAVADFFATREEYDAYAENATDLGEYNEDFERGVDESFANRPQNAGNSPVNSVPLESEPNGENNGGKREEDGSSGNGPSVRDNSGRTTDGGTEGGDQASPKVGKGKTNKGKAGKKVANKYPARKGNATQKLLVDTFGFNKVEIPNTRKETLNTIYDFMMAMSKILGISPKSIGQGGWLDVGPLRSNASASAEHTLLSKTIDQSIVKATLKYKYSRLSGLAHEWWHALDHALSYFETGKGKIVASEIAGGRFTGRQEAWEAVQQVIRAIKDSGHQKRMYSLKFPRRYTDYLVEHSEMAARAFDEYIKAKFADAGIVIENAENTDFIAQPTPEEMAVIAPAFDNLFKVLQEKEGKTPGTSVLYHIGEQMEQNNEVKQELGELVAEWIRQGGNMVVMDSAQMADALEREGLTQNAKRPRRTIINRDLTSAEKQRIQKYILSLPLSDVRDRPYLLMTRNYAYVFNTFRALYEENTTQKPIGDGFEILHKKDIRSLTKEQKKELERRYNNDEERRTINGWLQAVGDVIRGLPVSVSDSSNTGAGVGYASMASGEHREETRANGVGNSGLRNTGEVQKLETPDGIIYGFVKDGVIYLDPTLLNPNTTIHEYTHLWDNALMQFNPALWERGKALMKQTPIWDEVINDPNYADIKDDENLVASEVHSRLVGTNGAERIEQLEQQARDEGLTRSAKKLSILGRLKEWLNDATQWLKDAFTGVWSKEELDAVTLTDFLNMPLRDLANFTELPKAKRAKTREEIQADKNSIKEKALADIQNAAVDYLAGEPRLHVIENAVNEEAGKAPRV